MPSAGLLNATLGNLTELIIALAAFQAGEYMLVKASIAGAIVTNALFMLGASLPARRACATMFRNSIAPARRLHAALLLMATVALLTPAAVANLDHLPQGSISDAKAQHRPRYPAHRRLRAEPACSR